MFDSFDFFIYIFLYWIINNEYLWVCKFDVNADIGEFNPSSGNPEKGN